MKARYAILLIVSLLTQSLAAQTATQAKKLYDQGNYEEAKAAYKKLLKAAPNNGNYNLWYGICCLETGEPQEALKPLETAVKRRVTSGQLHLARALSANYRYEEAIETFEEYIAELEKRKRSTTLADSLLEQTRANLRLLKGVEEVCVVDSFVVNKAQLLDAYRLSPESGSLHPYTEYFADSGKQGNVVYETELGNQIYYAELQADSTMSILTASKLTDHWSCPTPLPGNINAGRNAAYPYALSDGITMYFAADGDGSIGGYDIYVTRYNTNSDSYLEPENLGMPFNSPANDYLYVVDELNNLGWFASDRNQPADSVCVYVFVPNSSKQVYNYEAMEHGLMVRLAQLHSIAETQSNPVLVANARQRLDNVLNADSRQTDNRQKREFSFVINDQRTYHHPTDFHSAEARSAYSRHAALQAELTNAEARLLALRNEYATADAAGKQQRAPQILELEQQVNRLRTDVQQSAIAVRRLELNN